MRRHILLITGITLLTTAEVLSQEKEKNIGTEVVNVVKPYTPTLSDAFKIKETPTLNDSVTTQKKQINYSIYSVPVASTFTPAKGKAAGVQKTPKEKLYNTFVSLGLGNYSTAVLDFYTGMALSRDQTFDVSLNHHSSQGGIDMVDLDDHFFNTKLDASYKVKDRYLTWGANVGFQHQIYNWYGIPADFYDDVTLGTIDEKQTYYTAHVGADLTTEDAIFKGGEVLYRRFWDGFDSAENRLIFKPGFTFPVQDETIDIDLTLDYLGGEFDRGYADTDTEALKYSYLMAGVTPSLTMLEDDLTLHLGATFMYNLDTENSDSNIFIYPNVSASYRLVEEYVTVYGGLEGKLIQNSYYDLQKENQYVSPTQIIVPTDRKYDAYVGVKGKFSPSISYNLRGSYIAENDRVLYRANPIAAPGNPEGYAFGNSYGIIYDDVKTISVFGEINVSVNRNFNLGLNAEFFDYNMDNEPYAWNLPDVKGSLFADYQISEKWFAGANLFFIGERYDLDFFDVNGPITLDSYFDANLHLGYRINTQLSAFIKANNIANNEYARWSNYPVQGFQILAGATYKFDL